MQMSAIAGSILFNNQLMIKKSSALHSFSGFFPCAVGKFGFVGTDFGSL
jgi:hypothetical protein